MKDKCNMVVVENVVRDLMQTRKYEFSHNVNRSVVTAKQSIDQGEIFLLLSGSVY